MGTDIHMYLELFRDGKWVCKPDFSLNQERDYYFFSLLAGIRNYGLRKNIKPIVQGRGLPPDLSESVQYEEYEWENIGHSANYLTLEELRVGVAKLGDSRIVIEEEGKDELEVALNNLQSLVRDLEVYTDPDDAWLHNQNGTRIALQPDQIRIVFWFDN